MTRSLDLSLLNPVELEYLFTAEIAESAEMAKKEVLPLCVLCVLSGKLKRLKEAM